MDDETRRDRHHPPPVRLRLPATLALVAAGGFLGGLIRYATVSVVPLGKGGFPWALFAVNSIGALALGMLGVALARRALPPLYLRPLLVTGLLGALTTFSGVAAQAVETSLAGAAGTAAAFVVGSTVAAIGGVTVGRALARSWPRTTGGRGDLL